MHMCTLATVLSCLCSLHAFSQGHYQGSSFNPNDHFAPPPGFIVPLYYSYANMGNAPIS
jgi:hypothetical protein